MCRTILPPFQGCKRVFVADGVRICLAFEAWFNDTAKGDPDIAGCRGVPDSESLNRSIVATSGLFVGAAGAKRRREARDWAMATSSDAPSLLPSALVNLKERVVWPLFAFEGGRA